jgi:hypothetical protein
VSSVSGYAYNPPTPDVYAGSQDRYNPDGDILPRAESPPPLPGMHDPAAVPGLAVEMDATTGSPPPAPHGFGQFGIRESDADVAGMLAMQQARMSPGQHRDTHISDNSKYSRDE